MQALREKVETTTETSVVISASELGGTASGSMAGKDAPLMRLFLENGVRVRHPAGRTLIEEGEVSPGLYLILTGFVRESMLLTDGRRHIVDFYGRCDVFGHVRHGEAQHLLEAATEINCLRLQRSALRRLAEEGHSSADMLLLLAERRLSRAQRKMQAMGCLCSVQRTAQFLLWLAEMDEASLDCPVAAARGIVQVTPGPTGRHRIPVTRREIADHLGLTLETVCRSFSRLKELELVEMPSPNVFRIPDRPAVESFILGTKG